MNKLEQGIDRLKQEVQAAECSLVATGQHLASAVEEKVDALDLRLKNALGKYEAKLDGVRHAGHSLRDFVEKKRSELTARFEDWKTDREIGKIEKRADEKEEQAVEAIMVAAVALHAAEIAVLEALKARKFALEVAG